MLGQYNQTNKLTNKELQSGVVTRKHGSSTGKFSSQDTNAEINIHSLPDFFIEKPADYTKFKINCHSPLNYKKSNNPRHNITEPSTQQNTINSSSFMASSRKTLLLQNSLKTPGIGYYDLNTKLIHPKIIKNIKINSESSEKFNFTSNQLDEVDLLEIFKTNRYSKIPNINFSKQLSRFHDPSFEYSTFKGDYSKNSLKITDQQIQKQQQLIQNLQQNKKQKFQLKLPNKLQPLSKEKLHELAHRLL